MCWSQVSGGDSKTCGRRQAAPRCPQPAAPVAAEGGGQPPIRPPAPLQQAAPPPLGATHAATVVTGQIDGYLATLEHLARYGCFPRLPTHATAAGQTVVDVFPTVSWCGGAAGAARPELKLYNQAQMAERVLSCRAAEQPALPPKGSARLQPRSDRLCRPQSWRERRLNLQGAAGNRVQLYLQPGKPETQVTPLQLLCQHGLCSLPAGGCLLARSTMPAACWLNPQRSAGPPFPPSLPPSLPAPVCRATFIASPTPASWLWCWAQVCASAGCRWLASGSAGSCGLVQLHFKSIVAPVSGCCPSFDAHAAMGAAPTRCPAPALASLPLFQGNQHFLALSDVLHTTFVEGCVCMLKYHPIMAVRHFTG